MKTCFKCFVSKPISDFYPHPRMADGHLNKCKSCTKKDSNTHRESRIDDPDWVEQERIRCRDKAARQRAAGTAKQSSNAVKKKWAGLNHYKVEAERLAQRAVEKGELLPSEICENCSAKDGSLEMHHHDYTRPLAVVWLCIPCHKTLHRKQRNVPIKRRIKTK